MRENTADKYCFAININHERVVIGTTVLYAVHSFYIDIVILCESYITKEHILRFCDGESVVFISYAVRKPARLVLQDECGRDSIPKGVGNTIR